MILNYVWIAFILIAFIVALFKLLFENDLAVFGTMFAEALSMAKFSVMDIALPLSGVMIFWMGMMKIAENSGLVNVFSSWLWPFFKYLFPEVPKGHPAAGAMAMNLSANVLGLDNAATPLGINAMKELQSLNPEKDKASNAQIMFLVLNTSGLTVIPSSIIALRAASNSQSPTDIFIPILIATAVSTIAGIATTSVYQKINLFKSGFLIPLFVVISLLSLLVGSIVYFSYCDSTSLATEITDASQCFSKRLGIISGFAGSFIILLILFTFIAYALHKRNNAYESFIEGAREGFNTAVSIIPYLIAMLVAIALFRSSGAMNYIIEGLRGVFALFTSKTEFADALPTALMRPLSGSGSRAMMIECWKTFHVDSLQGRMASVIQGSTETTFYTIAVYFGSVGIKKVRHTIACGLAADIAGIIAAIWISYIFF
jgi:spore maturation protein SpmA